MTTTTVSENIVSVPAEPAILAANTYFWTPAMNASGRRSNEERKLNIVADYLSAIGFVVTDHGSASVTAEHESGVKVTFGYSESCANVYKSLSVSRNGKNSNITAIRKIAAAL